MEGLIQIEEGWIKTVLSDYESFVKTLHDRILQVYEFIGKMDDLKLGLAMGNPKLKDVEGNCRVKTDLSDLMMKQQKVEREYVLDLYTELWRLTEELESAIRIWACYQSLRGKQYEIIKKLYTEDGLWTVVEAEMKLNHRVFVEQRRLAMDTIIELYNSKKSNEEILLYGHQGKSYGKKKSSLECIAKVNPMIKERCIEEGEIS